MEIRKQEISDERLEQTEEHKRLARETYERFDELKRARMNVAGKNMDDIWDQNEKNLIGYTADMPDDENRSNLFIPITHGTIDTIMAEWTRQPSSGRVVPSEDPEDEPKARILDFCIKYIENKNRVAKVDMETHYDTIASFGNGIQMIYYKEGRRKVRTISKVNPDGTKEYKEVIKKDFDDICIEKVDPRMIYPDSAAREADFSDCGDVIHRKILTYTAFEVEYDGYENTKYVKRGGDIVENDFFDKPKDMDDTDVEVLWWWNKTNDFLRIVANGILLEDKPLPYDHKDLPFVGTYDIRRPGQFWGISTAELMSSLQDEFNSNRNMRLDGQRISTLKMYWVPKSGQLEDDELIAEPGKFYEYSGVQPPIAIDVSTDFTASYMSEDRMKDDIVTTTGVDRKPESEGPNETATSVAVKREATLKRIAKKIYQNQIMLEQKRGELLIALILQYYTTSKFTKIAGKEEIDNYKGKEGFEIKDDGVYQKVGKRIRIDNKDVKIKTKRNGDNVEGVELDIKEKNGYTFFNVTKDLVNGKYDFVITPDLNIPTTKAQEIEMATVLYDRLMSNPLITSPDGKMYVQGANGQLEPRPMPKGIVKLTENFLKKHGYAINDFLPDEAESDNMVSQAMKESVMMLNGEVFGPTPLASPDHTMVHNRFMEQNVDESMPEVMEAFNNHIMGELAFQKKIASGNNIRVGGTSGPKQIESERAGSDISVQQLGGMENI